MYIGNKSTVFQQLPHFSSNPFENIHSGRIRDIKERVREGTYSEVDCYPFNREVEASAQLAKQLPEGHPKRQLIERSNKDAVRIIDDLTAGDSTRQHVKRIFGH